MDDVLLTTIDNPFNPFDQWDEWLRYDRANGHDTLNYLARVAKLSPNMSEADQDRVVRQATFEIVEQNLNGMYTVVRKDLGKEYEQPSEDDLS